MIEDVENMTVVTGGILLDSETSSVKINEGVKIDLGALTKGYAVEMVYNYLRWLFVEEQILFRMRLNN